MVTALDAVEGLGAFVEVEALIGTEESGRAVQEHLDGLVRSLGVPLTRTTDTYDSLLRSAAATG